MKIRMSEFEAAGKVELLKVNYEKIL